MGKLTYNTRLIFQSDNDKHSIIQMLESQRFAWNECSKVKFSHVSKNSIVELHAKFYKNFRANQPQIRSQVIISAENDVLSAYRSVKSCKHNIKKPLEKKELSIRLDTRSYSYKNKIFSIIYSAKRIKCSPYIYSKLEQLLNKYKICDPLIFEKNDEIWICITFNIPEIPLQSKLAIGIDLGCRRNAVTSEGNLYVDRKFNGEKRILRFNRRKLQSKMVKGSKSAKRHLKKLRRKEANKNKNFSHHLANKLIKDTKADTLVLENLKSVSV